MFTLFVVDIVRIKNVTKCQVMGKPGLWLVFAEKFRLFTSAIFSFLWGLFFVRKKGPMRVLTSSFQVLARKKTTAKDPMGASDPSGHVTRPQTQTTTVSKPPPPTTTTSRPQTTTPTSQNTTPSHVTRPPPPSTTTCRPPLPTTTVQPTKIKPSPVVAKPTKPNKTAKTSSTTPKSHTTTSQKTSSNVDPKLREQILSEVGRYLFL